VHAPATLLTILLLSLLGSVPTPAGDPSAADPAGELLLGETYPLETRNTFHAALVHWLDSLGGLEGPAGTAGKTQELLRRQYETRFGRPDGSDLDWLRRYVLARISAAEAAADGAAAATTETLFAAPGLKDALAGVRDQAGDEAADTIRGALDHFAPRYRLIWNGGEVTGQFLAGARSDPRRGELATFLAGVARFFGTESELDSPPSLVLAPVPRGGGTHAQAVGRYLLIEIRPGEGLLDQSEPIVHENAHFLFYRISPDRRAALGGVAARSAPTGEEAWNVLHEALPTAIAQGVAGQRFRGRRFSRTASWYHLEIVDRYAKALFPLVRASLKEGRRFDESFVRDAVGLYVPDPELSRRSP